MSNDELCDLIETAFSEAPMPKRGTLSVPTYDDEDTNAFFGGTDWHSHTVAGLRWHDSSLTFFTPAAFRYYLPAYLICSIRNPIESDIIPENIVSHLQRDLSSGCERLRTLSINERTALARFLEWMRDEERPDSRKYEEFTALVKAIEGFSSR